MKDNYRKILILAAGIGKRLMPLTADRPKCLVEVGGRPILFYQLSALSACGVKDIIIVTGYRASMIEEYIAENFSDLRVRFIHDDVATGKLYSWHLAKEVITGNQISLDSDIIFHPAIISAALSLPEETSAGLFYRKKWGEKETKVSVSADGRILDIGKDLRPDQTSGKFTGIYVFSEDFSRLFFTAAKELLNSDGSHAFGFDAIRKIRDEQNLMLKGLDVSQYPFIEIDFPEDIRTAEKEVLPQINAELTLRNLS